MRLERQQATHLLELLWVKEKSAASAGHVTPHLLQSLVAVNVGLDIVDCNSLKGRVRSLFDTCPAHRRREHLALSLGHVLGLLSGVVSVGRIAAALALVVRRDERLLLLLH